jgi:hypothetical protein
LIPAPSYLTVSDADDYFTTRLNSDVWFAATVPQKSAALVTATRVIDNLNFYGLKADSSQPLEFPRRPDYASADGATFAPACPATTPTAVLIACCEEAVVRLDGVDPELEMQGLHVQSSHYASVRETYDRAYSNESVRAGIMSQVAWNHLVPFLADAGSISLSRV